MASLSSELQSPRSRAIAKAPYQLQWKFDVRASVICVSATSDASLIAVAAADRTVRLLSFEGRQLWHDRLDYEAWSTAISADGSRIAVGTADKSPSRGTVYLYDREGHQIYRHDFGSPVWALSLSADGTRLIVGCWDNQAYYLQQFGLEWRQTAVSRFGDLGVYGVSVTADGSRAIVASYDKCITLVTDELTVLQTHPVDTGTYRASITPDGKHAIVGLREGQAWLLDTTTGQPSRTSRVSSRPICGVDLTPDAMLFALGSFDGHAYIVNCDGNPLWSYQTSGEVWSLDISDDGTLVTIGSGDGTVTLLRNRAATAAMRELLPLERRIRTAIDWRERRMLTAAFVDLCLRFGLTEYGQRWLMNSVDILGEEIAAELTQQLLQNDVEVNPEHAESHCALATLMQRDHEWLHAASEFLKASRSGELRFQSLISAGECFAHAGMTSASLSCLRRAREHVMAQDDKRVLYNLRAFI